MTGLFYGEQPYEKRGNEYFRILTHTIMNVFVNPNIKDSYLSNPYHNSVVSDNYPVKALLFKNYEI